MQIVAVGPGRPGVQQPPVSPAYAIPVCILKLQEQSWPGKLAFYGKQA